MLNFGWIVDGRVGGMARPRPQDAAWLKEQGVTALVSLTERPVPLEGIDVRHLPVRDMDSPTLEQLRGGVDFMQHVVASGGSVVAHCGAGMGRTGTFLAAFLVGQGVPPDEAIRAVRERRPGSIETPEQERVIYRFAELLEGGAA